jgi:hypothetical protein
MASWTEWLRTALESLGPSGSAVHAAGGQSWSLIADKSPRSINHALQLLVEETGTASGTQPECSRNRGRAKGQKPSENREART